MFKRTKFGEVSFDHRFSPGLTEADIARFAAAGDLTPMKEGTVTNMGTLTCAHCSVVVIMNPERKRDRGRCSRCDHYICDGCVALGDCRPIQALADAVVGSDKPLNPLSPLILRR